MARRAAKKDDNHAIIVEALRAQGAFVQDLAGVGQGCPDVLCGHCGVWRVLEIKDGSKVQSARTLTDPQIKWIMLLGNRAPMWVVETVEQALDVIRGKCDG